MTVAERFGGGVRLPRTDTLLMIAGALDADPEDLMAGLHWDIASQSWEIAE